ncbi:CAP domain-containing protein [Streptomyces sp. NPDC000410]|uniref:CAP domain-containing protein n=1 Tax=Streptomyces sp. NPDC000410 TaxID=3154254 RepID=UPI003324A201
MGRHRRKNRATGPVRTGLLGACAAMAVGAVAVATGVLPGGEKFVVGSGSTSGEQIRTDGPGQLNAQGGASATPSDRPSTAATRSAERVPVTPSASPSSASAKPSSPTPSKTSEAPEPKKPTTAPEKSENATPERRAAPPKPSRSKAPSGAVAAEATVLSLVNAERAKVGCSPVRADASLGALAGAFSADMAARGFFDHTDPDGDDPWDRARQSGVSGLGGENIARGQADARTVMDSWMNSDGHRANILNCDYKTLGVGVHFADGGPWWTQDFGF